MPVAVVISPQHGGCTEPKERWNYGLSSNPA
jgi:hypothetical protein